MRNGGDPRKPRAFSGKVDTGFPQKMRSNKESRAPSDSTQLEGALVADVDSAARRRSRAFMNSKNKQPGNLAGPISRTPLRLCPGDCGRYRTATGHVFRGRVVLDRSAIPTEKVRSPAPPEIPRHDLGRSGAQSPPVNDRRLVDLTAGNWSITLNREDDDGKLAQ